jgi:hypothetical protein
MASYTLAYQKLLRTERLDWVLQTAGQVIELRQIENEQYKHLNSNCSLHPGDAVVVRAKW